uniref:DUF7081 domain-containing protein n=1 Tax=Gossypium raimondii TaxID=29730 RepID=A0A0D2R8X5_GOSRA|nr:hypothetical protein B456_005G043500 [Gossypium raimondii]KJB28323.1 hypothetical protein B456_005G043500 [Gossypium raimondii]
MMSIPSPPRMGTPPHMPTASSIHETRSDMDSPLHIDLHQDLFPDYYGGPASIPSIPKEEPSRNDFPNGDNGFPPVIKENDFPTPPVPPCTSGEGLPYAPIDWPNPGDVWSWRVGRRVNNAGFYSDRFINVPKNRIGGLELSFLDDETTRAEFDNYLNALDDMLTQPLPEEPYSHPVLYNYFAAESEMAEARMKLSSFLDMDFPSLICFKDLDELTSLASKLRKDPTLTAEQLVKLKLIEEIPSFCEVFLENREIMEQADNFFTTLQLNKTKVTSLKQEYSELRQQVTNLQSEVDTNSLTVQEIDNQIAQLKSHRAQLTRLIENKKKDKEELTYNQKLVANSIPKVVHEVQLANARKPEWEIKKENADKREAEILAKFAPLKGFSL